MDTWRTLLILLYFSYVSPLYILFTSLDLLYFRSRPCKGFTPFFFLWILHRDLRNDFLSFFYFLFFQIQFIFSNFYLDLYFPFSIWTLFPFSIWTFISSLDFVSLFYLDFYSFFRILFLFLTFISLFAKITIWAWISSKFFFIRCWTRDFLKIINLYLRFCKIQNSINICRLCFQCFKLQKNNRNIPILLKYLWRKVGSENTLNICMVAVFSMLQIANAKHGIEICSPILKTIGRYLMQT